MTSEIVIPFGISVDSIEKRKVRNLIVNETRREPHIRSEKREMVIEPESPVHADNILQMLDEMDIKYYHE